ncbi:endocuticle structural glycoprotein ABD-5-like [Homarus americanus]|uniref:endocuticle structural glycoprotein ABD-5-like n=1 Tax=Homarus americanus TaxID=6706 RepID=UPI001C43E63C|nr:endocuticle structural glycoprotein ABD-5-like [Homarus americanus]
MVARLCFFVLVVVVAKTTAEQRASYGNSGGNNAEILKDERTQDGYGTYSFQYETSDGVTRHEYGSQDDGQVTNGGWRYTSPEGQVVDITFVADHGGYQPTGDVLPVAPALPYQRSQPYH